ALRRIGGSVARARVAHPKAQEAGHMFFGEALGSAFGGSLASHPPLPTRLRRVDPSWDGTMLKPLSPDDAGTPATQERPAAPARPRARAGEPVSAAAEFMPLLKLAGQPTPAHVEHARSLLESIPAPLRDAAHQPSTARAVVYALLLDPDEGVRRAQIEHLAARDRAVAEATRRLAPAAMGLDRTLRLPLLDMTLSTLAHLSDAQHRAFRADVRAL